jgi:hypothetical protein
VLFTLVSLGVCDLLHRGPQQQQQQQQQHIAHTASNTLNPTTSAAAAAAGSSSSSGGNGRHTLTLQQLARQLTKDGAEPSHDGFGRLLDAAVSLRLLGGNRDGYYLTDLAATYLTRDSQHSLVGYIIHSGEQFSCSWGGIKRCGVSLLALHLLLVLCMSCHSTCTAEQWALLWQLW